MRWNRCVCGCGRKRGLELHHVLYQQHIRREAGGADTLRDVDALVRLTALLNDRRNLVPLGPKCHAAHHNRSRPLPLRVLPDSVFEFAVELMGAGAAYEYLRRRYAGEDPRLDALIEEE